MKLFGVVTSEKLYRAEHEDFMRRKNAAYKVILDSQDALADELKRKRIEKQQRRLQRDSSNSSSQ